MRDPAARTSPDPAAAIAAALAEAPASLRSIVLVGPSGAGKTALARALVGAERPAGRDNGRDGGRAHDARSTGLGACSVAWDGRLVTVVDTPGYPDFLGEVRAGLRAADAALFVVSSVDGIDAATSLLWDECEAVGMPRAVVVTNLDRERADFDETVAVAQRLFTGGGGVLPLQVPIHADDGSLAGVVDLLTTAIHDWSTGAHRVLEPEPEHLALIDGARTALIEGIITESEDEGLMDRFLAGEPVEVGTLVRDLESAVARGHFHPVVAWSGEPRPIGTELLLDLIARGFPSPLEHPMPTVTGIDGEPRDPLVADPDGPLCAEVVRTTSDQYTGKQSIVRVFSGTLRADTAAHVCGHFAPGSGHLDHDLDERTGAVSVLTAAGAVPVGHAPAGSVVAVAKLGRAETGDTLSDPRSPLLMAAWAMPDPLLPVALRAASAADEDKLPAALSRLLTEDPTLRLEHIDHADGSQVVVWTMGEAHAELLVEHLRERFSIAAVAEELRIALRETLTAPARGTGRLVKQSGGHGQYAVVEIEMEPLPLGSGLAFIDKVVGGAVPRQYIASVEKGVRQQLERGVVSGYPMTDVQVTLVDGKAHSVDSSDMAFQSAGALAVRDAAAKVPLTLLEPVARIVVSVGDDLVGPVLGDLAGRRGQVEGTASDGTGHTIVTATVPESELARYAVDIRAISHGTGRFERQPAGYAPMPPSRAKAILGG